MIVEKIGALKKVCAKTTKSKCLYKATNKHVRE